jgi:UDP-N-acetylmuramoyl-L-alanyl-D-glutamate--2,6-diaminopimelate ligase
MIQRMLHQAGYKAGLMTTVGWGVGDQITPQIEHMTTMPPGKLLGRIKALKSKGAEYVVLEVTSHALGQNRIWGIPIDIAVLTNVTHEHLDYHGSFEKYLEAKRKLFRVANHNRKGRRAGVVNADDPSAELFAGDIASPLLYGLDKGELRASGVKLTPSGSTYTAKAGNDTYQITCQLPGSFNVYNSLAAVGVGRLLQLSKTQIEQGIAALEAVEGRMARLNEGQDFEVVVDYAHTPDSFEKLFSDLKPAVKGKIIVMFGSAGRRDQAKRAAQGEIAGKFCDDVILTEEDDRDEDGMAILEQIASGAEKAGKVRDKDLFLVHDRAEAIKFTIGRAKPGDMVLLLGKGHEKNIERAHGFDEWDEMAIAREAINQRLTS